MEISWCSCQRKGRSNDSVFFFYIKEFHVQYSNTKCICLISSIVLMRNANEKRFLTNWPINGIDIKMQNICLRKWSNVRQWKEEEEEKMIATVKFLWLIRSNALLCFSVFMIVSIYSWMSACIFLVFLSDSKCRRAAMNQEDISIAFVSCHSMKFLETKDLTEATSLWGALEW